MTSDFRLSKKLESEWKPLLFILIFAGFFILLNQRAFAQTPKITIGVADRPVFQHLGETGEVEGLDVELSRYIFTQAGFDITFEHYPWTRIVHKIELGELDVALSANDSPERREFAYFSSESFRLGHNVLFTTKDNSELFTGFSSLADLYGKNYRLAVQRGASYSNEYEALKELPWFARNLVVVDLPERALELLLKGRVDGFLGSEYGVKKWQENKGIKNELVDVFRLMSDFDAQTHIMYSKKSVPKEWVTKVDEVMARLKKSGEYQQRLKELTKLAMEE